MSTIDGTAEHIAMIRPAMVPPPGVRAVVFDVVGTLVEPSPSVAVAYQRAAARHGVERGVSEIDGLFRIAWRKQ
jgi:FMN phosphatase YigB (HAD superfamily)